MDNFELIGLPLGEEDELAFEALFTATDLKETVVENAEGRWFAFRDEAGLANQILAAECTEVVFMAAGLPLWLKGRRS